MKKWFMKEFSSTDFEPLLEFLNTNKLGPGEIMVFYPGVTLATTTVMYFAEKELV